MAAEEPLHWRGIQESISDICATVPISFVIADGIIAMEGNGPSGESASCLRVARLRWWLATSGGVYGVLTKPLSSKSGIA